MASQFQSQLPPDIQDVLEEMDEEEFLEVLQKLAITIDDPELWAEEKRLEALEKEWTKQRPKEDLAEQLRQLPGLKSEAEPQTVQHPPERFKITFFVLNPIDKCPPWNQHPQAILWNDTVEENNNTSQFHLCLQMGPEIDDYVEVGDVRILSLMKTESDYQALASPPDMTETALKSDEGLPLMFEQLEVSYVSLGQSIEYYENLHKLGAEKRTWVLHALRDAAAQQELWEELVHHYPTELDQLLGQVPKQTVQRVFRNVAAGRRRLSKSGYSFHFEPSLEMYKDASERQLKLDFKVKVRGAPATNVHVVIGSNGAGKSRLMDHLARALLDVNKNQPDWRWRFAWSDKSAPPVEGCGFTRVIYVSFSAVDGLPWPLDAMENRQSPSYKYVGLQEAHYDPIEKQKYKRLKKTAELAQEFYDGLKECAQNAARREQWRKVLKSLGKADPMLRYLKPSFFIRGGAEPSDVSPDVCVEFLRLSAGHKLVLLTLVQVVAALQDHTLVLIDEPECHLHPPLLSAYVNILSALLFKYNGAAILATHSPVVLQEVPKECVQILRQSGDWHEVCRPMKPTFGENLASLTQEVFGLAFENTGYHEVVKKMSKKPTLEQALKIYGPHLGNEALIFLFTLYAQRERRDRSSSDT